VAPHPPGVDTALVVPEGPQCASDEETA
jgi:hypothetical protein